MEHVQAEALTEVEAYHPLRRLETPAECRHASCQFLHGQAAQDLDVGSGQQEVFVWKPAHPVVGVGFFAAAADALAVTSAYQVLVIATEVEVVAA